MFKIKSEYYILPFIKTFFIVMPCVALTNISFYLVSYSFYLGFLVFSLGMFPLFLIVNNYVDELHKRSINKWQLKYLF